MKENFIICIQAVIPMFLLMALGYGGRFTKIVSDKELGKLNSLAFKFLFPFLMFNNIYSTSISDTINIKLIAFTIIAVGIEYLIATLVVLKIEKRPKSQGAMIQAIYRSNFVILGMPIAINIFGHGNVAITALMIAIVVPIYNVLAVVTLEVYRKGRISWRKIIFRVITNPLILGAIVGIIFAIMKIKLPGVIQMPVEDLAKAATPIALMILGASFDFKPLKSQLRNLLISVAGRLIIVPGAVLTVAYLLGFRGIMFVTIVSIFAAPCAISSYTMAREMNSDYELAGSTVVITSALCCFTMFLWLFIFKNMGAF